MDLDSNYERVDSEEWEEAKEIKMNEELERLHLKEDVPS